MMRRAGTSSLTLLALLLAFVAAGTLAAAGIGYRSGLWGLPVALHTLPTAATYLGVAGAAAALLALLLRHALVLPAFALVVGLGTAVIPWHWHRAQAEAPAPDVATAGGAPMAFTAVAPLRGAAGAPTGPDGTAPDGALTTAPGIVLTVPADAAFAQALQLARARGWRIVAADAANGRIEASVTTPWFGLVDDVVLRAFATDEGSRVDMRSAARQPAGDAGRNAARLRAFLTELQAAP